MTESDDTIICPYCDGDRCAMRETVQTKEDGKGFLLVKRCLCRDCGETFYAVKQFLQTGPFTFVRRDQLEPMTGMRIRRTPDRLRSRGRWT